MNPTKMTRWAVRVHTHEAGRSLSFILARSGRGVLL